MPSPTTYQRLPKARPLLNLGLKTALVAAPILLGATPSYATVTQVFNGFTGVFAPINWSSSRQGTGTTQFGTGGTIDPNNPPFVAGGSPPTTMKFTVNGASTPSAGQFTFNTAQLATALTPPDNYYYARGEFSFNWTWTFANGTLGSGNPFTYFADTNIATNLWTYTGSLNILDATNPANYTTSGTTPSVSVASGNVFGFRLASASSSPFYGLAEATISNFTFTAYFEEVPGPLPLAGAAAGFAWSRRLRKRLKLSQVSS